MNTNLLRFLAVVTGLASCAVAHAQTSAYQAPAKWSNYNNYRQSVIFRTVASPLSDDAAQAAEKAQELPIPAFVPAESPLLVDGKPAPVPVPQPMPQSMHSVSASGCNSCGQTTGAPYGCCDTGPITGPIMPWFGGANLLFLSLANDTARNLAVGDTNRIPYLTTSNVSAKSTVGFDTHIGRYFGCGRWGLDVGYFLFNPSEQSVIAAPGVAGAWAPAMPAFRDVSVNPGGGAATVWSYYDNAAAYRARRDMFFQGIEINAVAFGLLGARRAGICGPAGPMSRCAGRCGFYGGTCGPLARPCTGCFQIQALQGFRWFQLEDELEYAANINGSAGYQADDLYYNVETENNLFGYQLGSRVTYCVGPRLNIGLGGKIGLYGNHARYRQRLGTQTNLAYVTTGGVDDVSTVQSDAFLSTLGELDLGLGLRLTNAWTVRGGYRLLSACGVATATGSIAQEYTSLASSARVSADDCIILHGGYVGLDFNW